MRKFVKRIVSLTFLVGLLALCACATEEPQVTPPPATDGAGAHTHTYGEWYGNTATCTEGGKERRDCTTADCNAHEERNTEALGHDMQSQPNRTPTCTTVGWSNYLKCTRCSHYTRKELFAKGHSFGDWYGNTATCTEGGKERRDCTAIGCTAHEERDTSPLNHDLKSESAKPSTCTQKGWDAYQSCTRCDYNTKKELPLAKHDFGEWESYGEEKERRYCSNCTAFEERDHIDYVDLANKIFAAFGTAPDVWSFLPESFSLENRKADAVISYEDFVALTDIPNCGMGKQLNVMYGLLAKFDAASKYVNVVYGSMGTVKALYTAFLDSEPENDKVFTGDAGEFTFTLVITEEEYLLSISFKDNTSLELYGKTGDPSYGGSLTIANRGAFRFDVSGSTLTVGASVQTSVENTDNSISAMVSFTRGDGKVTGMLYEYVSVLGKEVVGTSAMIEIGETYTTIIGTKGDFTVGFDGRNCEVYDNATGKLIGTEVRESSKLVSYDTYWFPIYQLTGIDSIMKVDEKASFTAMNPDTVYINGLTGKNNILATKKVTTSRKFDIEFKTMYFYVLNTETGEYEEETMEIPMLFIQSEHYDTFESDFNDVNEHLLNGTAELLVTDTQKGVISDAYATLLPVYNEEKDAVTKEDIIDFCKG